MLPKPRILCNTYSRRVDRPNWRSSALSALRTLAVDGRHESSQILISLANPLCRLAMTRKTRSISTQRKGSPTVSDFFTREKFPFTCFLMVVKRKIGNFSLHHHQKTGSNPLGWGGRLFDKLFKSSG